jgi:hypothetical protein
LWANQEIRINMTKNMTQKGLALGAGIALVASGFGVAPANALGQSDTSYVSLSARTGTELAVLSDQYIDLKANAIDSISGTSGKDLKFLVSDPQSKVFVDQSQLVTTPVIFSQAAAPGANNIASVDYDATGGTSEKQTLVTVDTTALAAGEKLFIYGLSNAIAATALNGEVVTRVTATTAKTNKDLGAADISFNGAGGLAALTNGLNTRSTIIANSGIDNDLFEGATVTTSIPGKTISNGRATDGTFVINSETSANTSDRLLRLVTNSTSTYSVDVTAWVDSNDNGLIDTTEYASPVRTVTFQKAADLAVSTALTPIAGDTALTAEISTTPTLNGEQVLAQDPVFLNAAFTRQDSAVTVYSQDEETGTSTALWDNVTKLFSVDVLLDATASNNSSSVAATGFDEVDSWSDLAPAAGGTLTNVTHVGGVLTATVTAHKLRVGDKILLNAGITSDVAATQTYLRLQTARTVASVISADSFTLAVTGASVVAGTLTYGVLTYANGDSLVDRVFAGSYSAQAFVKTAAATWTALGTKTTVSTAAVTSATATLSTTGSATIAGTSASDNTANLTRVKTGTTSVPMTFQAFDSLAVGVTAGRPVVVSTTTLVTGTAAAVGTFKINGLSSPVTLYTDAAGMVSFTVTETAGLSSAQVRIQAVVEGNVTVGADLDWTAASYGLIDYNTTGGQFDSTTTVTVNRSVLSAGTFTLALGVTDQWFTAADAASYRLKVTGSGVTEAFVPLTAGKANVVVTDNGITAVGGTFTALVTLQKATSGKFSDTVTKLSVVTTVTAAPTVVLGIADSTLYGSKVVLSAAVAAKAIVEIDPRLATTVKPAYATNAVINGAVLNSATSAGQEGALVTISGPSNMLFENGSVSKRGSLSFLSAATTGRFQVLVYSTSAQTDSVVTVTVNGVAKTVKVSFTGIGVGEGTSLVVTMPAAVKPASTFQVKAKLADAFGNGVAASAGRVKVTYTGAGIVFGTLPTATDANGELMFSVLLGSNDTGSVNVTVSYDQNGDGDYVDTKDLVTAGTTAITATGVVAASSDTIVNVGTFSGKLVVYALNAAGSEVSYKIAGKWVTQVVTSDLLMRYDRVVGATGATIKVDIYVDGVLKLAKSVVTK